MIKLPDEYKDKREWTVLGPMGPEIPAALLDFPTLGIDGGANFASKLDLWVGDRDSLEAEVEALYQYEFPAQKDFSDLALGLSLFNQKHSYKLHLWGFRGGRLDHELFNLGEALRFLETHPESQILIYGPDGKIYFHVLGEGNWAFEYQGLFSVGTLKKSLIKIKGECDYPLLKETPLLPLSSHGLSNRARGRVEVQTSAAVFVCFPEGK